MVLPEFDLNPYLSGELYRSALRSFWRLTAAGAEADPAAGVAAYNEVCRFACCPRCGARGERHP